MDHVISLALLSVLIFLFPMLAILVVHRKLMDRKFINSILFAVQCSDDTNNTIYYFNHKTPLFSNGRVLLAKDYYKLVKLVRLH